MKNAVFLDLATVAPQDLTLTALMELPLSWEFYDSTEKGQLHERIKHAEIIVTNKCPLDANAFRHAPVLDYVCAAATGFNHIDIATALRRKITVSNVRNYATPSVVQHVYTLILALSTNLFSYRTAVQDGNWQRSKNFCLLDFPIEEVAGKKLGIIGYGVLGQAVAKVAPALGMDVLICQSLHGKPVAGRIALSELLATADIISLHLPLNEQTENLLAENELAMMKKSALLINTSRGGIIDETALAEALINGRIGGAGIDVLETEPPVDGMPLLNADIPRLIVTPHTAWASRQSRQRLVNGLAENITSFLNGEILNQVT